MSWPSAFALLSPPLDPRPIGVIEQDIRDELEFHLAMRTLDNEAAGMSALEARQDAVCRFGDFERIRKQCRQTLLGERIMLQRLQAVLTLALLGAVVFLGLELYRGQRANETAMATLMQKSQAASDLMMQKSEAATARMMEAVAQSARRPAASSPQFDVLEPAALDKLFPRDAVLTDVQRGFRDWSEATFPAMNAAWWEELGPAERTTWEDKWLMQLSSTSEKTREKAIQCLAAAGCKRAIPEVLKIAVERVEKDNADRCEAVRALGILGDQKLVPELVPLTYHYNMNTRLWAQIALARLTGKNFGRDVASWKSWWEKQGGQPPISDTPVVWATSSWMQSMLEKEGGGTPEKQDEMDRRFAKRANDPARPLAPQAFDAKADAPSVVSTSPKTADREVDPSLTEIRVTYSKPMMNGSWSWCYDPDGLTTTGAPHYEADGKTCVLPVKLEPGKTYTISLNSKSYHNFRDATGQPAIPYVLQFRTRQQMTSGGGAKSPAGPAERGAAADTGVRDAAAAKDPPDKREYRSTGHSDDLALPTPDVPPPDLEYRATDSDEDAEALVARVLKANSPWIEPKPLKASYSLLREVDGTTERSGPFSVSADCKRAVRIGSIVWTPLHSMARKNTPYTARIAGNAEWKGKKLVALDVTFDPPTRTAVGFGGQANASYSSSDSATATTRIVLDSVKAIPLAIACQTDALPTGETLRSAWVFDADFFTVDGAFAPKTFYWEGIGSFRERQEFQVVDGVWIFKQGDAWASPASQFDESRHIQRMKLVDLQIDKDENP